MRSRKATEFSGPFFDCPPKRRQVKFFPGPLLLQQISVMTMPLLAFSDGGKITPPVGGNQPALPSLPSHPPHHEAWGNLSSPTRDRTCYPLHWKHGVLTTGPLGSPYLHFLNWAQRAPATPGQLAYGEAPWELPCMSQGWKLVPSLSSLMTSREQRTFPSQFWFQGEQCTKGRLSACEVDGWKKEGKKVHVAGG